MRRAVYDLSMLLGVGLVVGGVAVLWGLGAALIGAGVGVIGMTQLAVRVG